MQEIYIYGCGGVGNELADAFLTSDSYQLMGFIDDNPSIRECMGVQCRTLDEVFKERRPEEMNVIISFGEPAIRRKVSERLAEKGIREFTVNLADYFNPAYSSVDKGTILHRNSYVSVNVHIGKCCMVNKYVLVGHGSRIGDYCVLSPKVVLGGDVKVGENTFIGMGALLRNGITIGKNVIVGMGSVVVNDIEDDAVVAGNPARFLRKNENRRVFKNK